MKSIKVAHGPRHIAITLASYHKPAAKIEELAEFIVILWVVTELEGRIMSLRHA